MRDPARIDRIIGLLRMVWERNPDQRLGQLYANLTGHHRDPFHVEDDEVESALELFLAKGWKPYTE